jgi:hypothetical protein
MKRNLSVILSFFVGSPLPKRGLPINWRWIAVLALAVQPCFAANHHVRSGASGNGSGSDWTNACTDFAGSCAVSSLVRGDTYYVAAGTYASEAFNTPESGTSVISILRATVSAHGTDTGWLAAYDGQVTWSFGGVNSSTGLTFPTGYWVFDGVTGSGNFVAGYGFTIGAPSNCGGLSGKQTEVSIPGPGGSGLIHNITLEHIGVQCCGASFNFNQDFFGLGGAASALTGFEIAHNYGTGCSGYMNITNLANSTIEYNEGDTFEVTPGIHAEVIATTSHANAFVSTNQGTLNNIVRYNIFKNCRSSGCFQVIGPGDIIGMNRWNIYGNIFVDDQSGDGVITEGGEFAIANTNVYNNTCYNCRTRFFEECQASTSCAQASGNTVENNLLIHSAPTISTGSQATGGPITHDYNTFWDPINGTPPNEPNGQIVASGCPVIVCAIDFTGDFRLLSDATTKTGLALPPPYDVDMAGNIRGADGTWERGALEFSSTSVLRPAPPQNLNAVVN